MSAIVISLLMTVIGKEKKKLDVFVYPLEMGVLRISFDVNSFCSFWVKTQVKFHYSAVAWIQSLLCVKYYEQLKWLYALCL